MWLIAGFVETSANFRFGFGGFEQCSSGKLDEHGHQRVVYLEATDPLGEDFQQYAFASPAVLRGKACWFVPAAAFALSPEIPITRHDVVHGRAGLHAGGAAVVVAARSEDGWLPRVAAGVAVILRNAELDVAVRGFY